MWKKCIKQTSENTTLLVVKDHHFLRDSRIIILEKLISKELNSFLISAIGHQPTSQNLLILIISQSLIICFLTLNYLAKRST